MRYFVDIGNKECYVATLYACYELIPSDVVDEISWRFGLKDYSMPYFINQKREQFDLVNQLKEEVDKVKVTEKETEEETPAPLMIGYSY